MDKDIKSEVSNEMLKAGALAYLDNRATSDDPYDVNAEELVKAIYLAMISAAPERSSP